MTKSDYWARQWSSGTARTSRRRLLGYTAAGAAGLGSLALVGCGDDDDSSASPTSGAGGSPGATSGPSGSEPVRGGILNHIGRNDLSTDPIVDSTSSANIFAGYVYSRLISYVPDVDAEKAKSGFVAPDLAALPEQPDEVTYTFKLNPEAVFQDIAPVNGRRVTAEDVVLSYERVTSEPKNTNKDKLLAVVEGSPVAIDANTIQFKTQRPFAPFLGGLLANAKYLWVYPKELLTSDELRANTPIGSGPWILKNRQQSVAWEFDRNPNYWMKDAAGRQVPYLDGVKVNVIPEEAQIMAQLTGGNLDVAAVTYENLELVKSQLPDARVIPTGSGSYYFLSPQQRPERGGPWLDERMRLAASMAQDRQGILELFFDGEGKWHGLTQPWLGDYAIDMRDERMGDHRKSFTRDVAGAKALASQAGYDGSPLRYIYTNNAYGEQFNQTAVFVSDKLNEAGFRTEVITQDYRGEFITPGKTFFGNYDGVWIGTEQTAADPYYILFNMLRSGNSWNHAGINDPQADALVDSLAAEFDREKRIDIVLDIEKMNAEKMFYVPLTSGPSYEVAQSWVKNYKNVTDSYALATESFAYTWIDRA